MRVSTFLILVILCIPGELRAAPTSEPSLTPDVVFSEMPSVFVPERARGMDGVFQFQLSGDGGGQWYVTVQDQVCRTHPGEHGSPTATIVMTSTDFLSLILGELDSLRALACGRMHIEGNLLKTRSFHGLFEYEPRV